MNQSYQLRQGRRRRQPAPDVLEDRMVLSAGQGSTFAIMPGTVPGPGMVSSLQFKLDPSLFSSPARDGRIVLGIDVTPAVQNSTGASTTSTLKPEVVSVKDASGHVIHVQHATYDRKVAKANKMTPGQTRLRSGRRHLHGPGQGTGCDQRNLSCRLLPSGRRRRNRNGHRGGYQDDQVGTPVDGPELELLLRRRRQS
jgi:hypothetical protein